MKTSLRNFIVAVFTLLGGLLSIDNAIAQKPKVLIAHAEATTAWVDEVRAKLNASGEFAAVDIHSAYTSVPTLTQLQGYNAVLTFSDNGYVSTAVGDVFAQYIEGGGGVVVATFGTCSGYNPAGAFANSTYQVLVPGGVATGQLGLGSVALPGHYIMTGVTSFNGGSSSYRSSTTTLTSGAYTIAYWSNNSTPLIAAKEDVGAKKARRVDLNFFPVSSDSRSDMWTSSTHGAKIMTNALVWVSGGGVPPARMSVTPKSLNYGGITIGDPSSTMCVTVKSVGESTLKFTGVSLAGTPDYSLVSPPAIGDSLRVGESRTICVKFNPLSLGTRAASLTIATNGADSGTVVVNLTGIGSAPAISVSDASLFRKVYTRLGDTSTACITITSTGTGPVRIDSVRITGLNRSAYAASPAPTSIPQGELANICVKFAPNFEGRTDANLVIYSNAFGKNVVTIPMFGTGILGRLVMTPPTLRFDSVVVGEEVCKTVSLSNPGTDVLKLTRDYIASSDPDFRYRLVDSIIQPGASVAFEVCFKPQRNGFRLAQYAFTTDIPRTFDTPARDTSLFMLRVTGTGVPIGGLVVAGPALDSSLIGVEHCVTDTLKNEGSAPITITSATIVGGDAADFRLSGVTLPLTLMPGDTRAVTLCITPSARGIRASAIGVLASTEGRTLNIQLPLAGFGLLQCSEPDATTLFGSAKTLVGKTETQTVTITNCGDVPTAYTASLGTSSNGYTIVAPSTSPVVAPNGTTTFTVEFTPTAIGPSSGMLNIAGGTGHAITLGATGAGVMLNATGNAGNTGVGDCQSFDITLANNGNVDWTPGSASINGTSAGSYTVESGPTPATIAAGSSGTIRLKFCPTAMGAQPATLTFPSSDPAPLGSTLPYALTGAGVVSNVGNTTTVAGFSLGQSYPNPMSEVGSIDFTLPNDAAVRIDIVDVKGNVLRSVSGKYPAGANTATLEVTGISSGTYFYVMTSGEIRLTRSLVIRR